MSTDRDFERTQETPPDFARLRALALANELGVGIGEVNEAFGKVIANLKTDAYRQTFFQLAFADLTAKAGAHLIRFEPPAEVVVSPISRHCLQTSSFT